MHSSMWNGHHCFYIPFPVKQNFGSYHDNFCQDKIKIKIGQINYLITSKEYTTINSGLTVSLMAIAATVIITIIVVVAISSDCTITCVSAASASQKESNVTITTIFTQLSNSSGMGKRLIEHALDENKS